jgi:ABC-2 type transport system permease protein
MRRLQLLSGYTRRKFLEWAAFRSFLFTLVVNQAMTPLLGLAVWSSAMPGEPGVSTYFVALLAVQLMTVSDEYYSVAIAIYEGSLNDALLRPHPVVIEPLGENIANRMWHLLIGLPFIAVTVVVAHAAFSPGNVLVAAPALIFAAVLRFLFTYILALSALWTAQAGGVTGFGQTMIFLLGGIAAPVMLLPDHVRSLGEALPFRSMLGFPAEIASGSLTTAQILEGYGWQTLWTVVLALAAAFVWRSGVRRYTAIGG